LQHSLASSVRFLGGIWADQSWGRFWGWDPKENGALIIVLWNALVLHLRWGGMIRERGLVNCAIVGNIVTSWSWFGCEHARYRLAQLRLYGCGVFIGCLRLLPASLSSSESVACRCASGGVFQPPSVPPSAESNGARPSAPAHSLIESL